MIGILSGAGPLAGLDVARKLIEETRASRDQDHLPVLLFSVPEQIPDRTEFLLGRIDENPGGPIGQLFLDLERAGATVSAIACNTAHADPIFDRVKEVVAGLASSDGRPGVVTRMQILHLLDETLDWMTTHLPAGQRIGILSTDGTRQSGLYRDRLLAVGFVVLEPDPARQPEVHGAIYDPVFGIKACSSQVDTQAVTVLEEVMDSLIAMGAQAILLGCTELPLALKARTYRGIPLIDPNRILARRLIEVFCPDSLTQIPH